MLKQAEAFDNELQSLMNVRDTFESSVTIILLYVCGGCGSHSIGRRCKLLPARMR